MMKPGALILFIGLVALASLACAQSPPTSAPTVSAAAAACTTENLIKNKVRFLQTPFDPRINASPKPNNSLSVDGNFLGDLQAAFDIAPQVFKDKLCGLTYIFIDPSGCANPKNCTLSDGQLVMNSWGLRGWQGGDKGEYIATSAGLWRNGAHAPIFSDYETARLRFLLGTLSSKAANWPHPPEYVSDPNTPALTVLAALSHEFGHVYWYDIFVPKRGGVIDPLSTFCKNKNKFNKFYPPGSWRKTMDFPSRQKRWIMFGEQLNLHRFDYVSTLRDDLNIPNFDNAAADLDSMLHAPNLAVALAAFSPVEDFVEAYELNVLKNATVSWKSLILQMYDASGNPSYTEDILAKLNPGTDLSEKAKCF